jgi:predicted short-subunit dehydrogenase-like oxidoreductase (DUF2520 family)
MTTHRLRVGIVGLEPGRSWAARAHIRALRASSDRFEIAGVANRSRESAERAAAETGLPKAFASVAELLASPDINVVTVAVRVPHHLELVSAAIDAGKHVIASGRWAMAWPKRRRWRIAPERAACMASSGHRRALRLKSSVFSAVSAAATYALE